MSVHDLNRDQIVQLKQTMLAERSDEDLSYGELADADSLVTDAEVFAEYAGTEFVEEDF